MELSLKFAPQADVRRFNAARFDPGLPPFGQSFRQPCRSFHEVVSDDEEVRLDHFSQFFADSP